MFDFQQKRKIRKVLYSRVTLFFMLVAVVFLARATYHIYTKEQMSAADYAAVEKSYNDLLSRQAMLVSATAKLNTQSGQDEEIRDKFSVAKPGETVVMVINSTNTAPTAQGSANTGLWQRFLGIFK